MSNYLLENLAHLPVVGINMKIALLTCHSWAGVFEKEQKLAAQISPNIQTNVVAWNEPNVDWAQYDCLIFRTIWDYFEYPVQFSDWLDELQRQNIRTLNPVNVIQRNQHKFYLRDLAEKGIDIIPTVFIAKNTGLDLSFIKEKGWEKAVIKPAVSAGAYLTKLFDKNEINEIRAEYAPIAIERDLLVQPFMPEIQQSGEVSLIFFQQKFVYAIVKKPKGNDFRVQSQFGGNYQAFEPDEKLIATAENIVNTFGENLLYARVDGIIQNGKFLLMEIELIEPDLYFDVFPDAQKRYIEALETMIFMIN